MAETLNTRVTRLEKAQIKMTNALAHLAEEHAKTDRVIRELRVEANQREKRVDARIEKLVSAMGEFIRRNGKS
jgi:prefoldin subunit 5